jgi:hypothetical protein
MMERTQSEIDADIAKIEMQCRIVNFLIPQLRPLQHGMAVLHEAKRQNTFRQQGVANKTEEKLDLAKEAVDTWLAEMKDIVRRVENVSQRDDGGSVAAEET